MGFGDKKLPGQPSYEKTVMTLEIKHPTVEEIKELYGRGKKGEIIKTLSARHPSEVARIFEGLEEGEVVGIFRLFDKEFASLVILETEGALRELLVSSISSGELVEIIDTMETDDATDVIAELSVEDAKEVLDGIKWQESAEVHKLLKYPEDTAGGKMQTEVVSVKEDSTVRETIEEVRRKSKEVENIPNVFVVSRDGKLIGTVSLDRLILEDEDSPVKAIANINPVKVTTDVDQEDVAKLFQRHDLLSMPVVDKNGCLVGRIMVDDVVDVIEDEIFEDFYRMAGLNTDERVLDSPTRSFWMRSPWLMLNLLTAFVAASVVKVFESTIETLVILAVFMPVVAGMGGNAGIQAITVSIRGLALGELELKYAWRVIFKEAIVGFANGVLVGGVAAFVSYLLGASLMIGLLLFISMTLNMVIAGLSGAVIPLVLKAMKKDPALSAGIFVTTCTDVGGFFVFLGLGAVFIKLGLL